MVADWSTHPDLPATLDSFAAGDLPPEVLADWFEDRADVWMVHRIRGLSVRRLGRVHWYIHEATRPGPTPAEKVAAGNWHRSKARAFAELRDRLMALVGVRLELVALLGKRPDMTEAVDAILQGSESPP